MYDVCVGVCGECGNVCGGCVWDVGMCMWDVGCGMFVFAGRQKCVRCDHLVVWSFVPFDEWRMAGVHCICYVLHVHCACVFVYTCVYMCLCVFVYVCVYVKAYPGGC